ncbi:hypothetical protein PAHAL_9G342300 [Panicum hallii]|uniref:Uncharacterized protein n=1 Tax=Panicum hallii TaxID=206008 RepID=A0A2S3IMU5_9POAL|nr:hypothetical protein PAHAL_9G342300 [Panicum hallii]
MESLEMHMMVVQRLLLSLVHALMFRRNKGMHSFCLYPFAANRLPTCDCLLLDV